jgi:hypothetical protein
LCLLLWLAYATASRLSAHMYRLVHMGAAYAPDPPAGWMFWLWWKVLPGS